MDVLICTYCRNTPEFDPQYKIICTYICDICSMNARIYIHTYIHTHIYKCIHTSNTYMYTNICTYIRDMEDLGIHTQYTHTHTHTIHTHTHTHTQNTHTHTHKTRTHTHTHKHSHTCTPDSGLARSNPSRSRPARTYRASNHQLRARHSRRPQHRSLAIHLVQITPFDR